MLSIESKHVLVLANEVIVEDDRCLSMTFLLLIRSAIQWHHGQHVIVILELTLASIIINETFVSINSGHVDFLLDATIALSFDLLAVSIMHFLHLLVVPVHQFGKPTTKEVTLFLNLSFAKVPLREVLFLALGWLCSGRSRSFRASSWAPICTFLALHTRVGVTFRVSTKRGQFSFKADRNSDTAAMLRLKVQIEPVFVKNLSALDS